MRVERGAGCGEGGWVWREGESEDSGCGGKVGLEKVGMPREGEFGEVGGEGGWD